MTSMGKAVVPVEAGEVWDVLKSDVEVQRSRVDLGVEGGACRFESLPVAHFAERLKLANCRISRER
jgi:hypothetical protein